MKYDILVNKDHPLLKCFVPEDLVIYPEYNGEKIDPTHKTYVNKVVLDEFYKMQACAKLYGYYIIIDSAYRSYEYQEKVLENGLQNDPENAYKYIAFPGTSEHQLGLAIDVALYIDGKYEDKFDDTFEEIKWLHNFAYLFGFILRYPKGKEEITGFNYECWHFRYVGRDIAKYMHDNNILTFEEYLELNKHR